MKGDRNIRLWRNHMRSRSIKLICSGRQIIWSTRSHISLIHYSIFALTVTQKNLINYQIVADIIAGLLICSGCSFYIWSTAPLSGRLFFVISVKQKTAFWIDQRSFRQSLMNITDNKILAISNTGLLACIQ